MITGHIFASVWLPLSEKWHQHTCAVEGETLEHICKDLKFDWLENAPTNTHVLMEEPFMGLMMTHNHNHPRSGGTNTRLNESASTIALELFDTYVAVNGDCVFFCETTKIEQMLEELGI